MGSLMDLVLIKFPIKPTRHLTVSILATRYMRLSHMVSTEKTVLKNRMMPEAKRATPPVALLKSFIEERMLAGIRMSANKRIKARTGAQIIGSFIVFLMLSNTVVLGPVD